MVIGLLGDVMLGRMVAERLADGGPEDVWAPDVRELARSCDAVICNLECCISSRGRRTRRIPRKPFFFRAPPLAVRSLAALGVRAVGLANNHALDFESEALLDTLELLDRAGIAVAGAGADAAGARGGVTVRTGTLRVGLLALSDHPREFAAAPKEPGIAFAELEHAFPAWMPEELGRLRAECDFVIAFPHWGPNMSPEPTSWQRREAARLQEAGADLVAGHSAHVFHGVGWGPRGPALYDLGDALDDYAVDPDLRNDLGVMAIWRPRDPQAELELAGLALDFCHTRLAVGQEAEWITRRLERACPPLGTRVERIAEARFRISPT